MTRIRREIIKTLCPNFRVYVLQGLASTNDLNSLNFVGAAAPGSAGDGVEISDSTVAVNNGGKFGSIIIRTQPGRRSVPAVITLTLNVQPFAE